jgi:hypothetical protein
MHIDNETYCVKDSSRYKTQIAKTQIILATSLRKDSNHIIRLQHKEYGKTKKWNTFTVSRIGTIYQHYDPRFHSDFIGIKEVDKKSISIVVENMGCLFKTPSDKYINWLNEICPDENVMEKDFLGYHYWENFTDEQLQSTVELCSILCEEHGIPKLMIDFHHFHKDTIKFRGIVFRSNYIEDSSDINPSFDIQRFTEMLRN